MLAMLFACALVFGFMPAAEAMRDQSADRLLACLNSRAVQLNNALHKAWINHTIWTRAYIVSAIADLPDRQAVLERLLRNQQDIGDLYKPYYGEAAGNRLAALLKEHIVIAGKIVEAAKAGNQAEVEKLDADWHRNADEIARFLSSANPNWQFKTLQDILYTHLQLITEVVLNHLKGDWEADIAATDRNEIHILQLADLLTEGIVRQFPEKF